MVRGCLVRQDCSERDYQFRDPPGSRTPDSLVKYLSIFVGENVALAYNSSPRDVRVCLGGCFGHPSGRFSNDLNMPLDGAAQHAISKVVLIPPALHECLDC